MILFTIGQDYNIKTGAAYFASVLEQNCGDILLTIGEYNGWKHGMTYVSDSRLWELLIRRRLTRVMLRVPLILAADAKTTSTSKSFLTSMRDIMAYIYF